MLRLFIIITVLTLLIDINYRKILQNEKKIYFLKLEKNRMVLKFVISKKVWSTISKSNKIVELFVRVSKLDL